MGKIYSIKKKNNLTYLTLLFILSGSIMIGHGARMIYQGIFQTNTYYQPALFDLFFDWLSLLILGLFILSYGFHYWFKHTNQNKNRNPIFCPT